MTKNEFKMRALLALCNGKVTLSSTEFDGMLKAAEVMALTAVYVAEQPETIETARKELLRKNGGKYVCPLPEYVQPPIGRY